MISRKLIAIDLLLVAVVLGSIAGLAIVSRPAVASACRQAGQRHRVALVNDRFTVSSLNLRRCDSLVIANQGSQAVNLNFGRYQQHQNYPGYTAKTLLPQQDQTIVAQASGDFELHDHFRDNAVLQLHITD
jgi:hypothetical protein